MTLPDAKYLAVAALTIALTASVAACSGETQIPLGTQSAGASVHHLIWEPPPVLAFNQSDVKVFYTVQSPCSPVPYSPSSGNIAAGSVTPLDFEPNGNACSYDAVDIQATDASGTPSDTCYFHVAGYNVDVINYSNTDCTLTHPGSKWQWGYKLISGAKRRH